MGDKSQEKALQDLFEEAINRMYRDPSKPQKVLTVDEWEEFYSKPYSGENLDEIMECPLVVIPKDILKGDG